MDDVVCNSGSYQVEASGWGLDDSFFVEQTDLQWTDAGERKLWLHRCLSEGVIVFVRLLNGPGAPRASLPVAYRVQQVGPMSPAGLCEIRLVQMHPRGKTAPEPATASQMRGESHRINQPEQKPLQIKPEEILHEA